MTECFLIFRAPHSYTGENTAEITCHGGIHVTKKGTAGGIIRRSSNGSGGRVYKAGACKRQAVLTEAEGVIDLINAGNDQLLSCARAQTDGALYRRIEALCEEIIAITSEIAVWIDYPDESEDEDEIAKADWL